ncbi:transglycosylase SLT domain-containing protein [Microbulbifer sp. CnH-101-G]|uniref:transglycosylase SLT domain-containing protein n=1 Tax=Microbulbifer sp. CnH-101-G TaxID=3243393 RepID=UPI004039BE4B
MNRSSNSWFFTLSVIALIGTIIYACKVPKNRLKSIKEVGILTVATRMDGVGCFYHRDQLAGLECDLLQAYAENLGVDVEFKRAASINESLTMAREKKADIAASDLTYTNRRWEQVTFSHALFETREVLVQRKENALTQFKELKGKTLTIHLDSAYIEEVKDKALLQKIPLRFPSHPENTAAISIDAADNKVSVLELIDSVSMGEIDFTIADEHIVNGSNGYNDNLDTSLVFGENRWVAFALTKDHDTSLVNNLNQWLESEEAQTIVRAYLSLLKTQGVDNVRGYALPKGTLSPWDRLFKRYASEPFDWVWLAAQTSTESNFRPNAVSLAGAQGLMQLMPETAKEVGVKDSFNPTQNIRGGSKYNQKQYRRWKNLPKREAMAFTFASYNAGAGHVLDARRLALQDGANPDQWFSTSISKGVEDYIVLLQKAEYYNSPMAKYGYCRGTETRQYVRKIFQQEASYRSQLKDLLKNKELIPDGHEQFSDTPYKL